MNSSPPFELFSPSHLWTIVVTLAVVVTVPLLARHRLPAREARALALAIAVGLVVYRTGWTAHRVIGHGDPLRNVVPLGICPLLFYLCAWVLWKRDQAVYEVSYYWALSGTLQSLITPDVTRGFPDREYLSFFASHGALILAVLYATFVFDMRPRWSSIPRVTFITALYAAVLIPINALLGTNHMYVNAKPVNASLLDYLGPWPWYNLTGIGLALVLFSLAYVPFFVASRWDLPTLLPVRRSAACEEAAIASRR